MAAKRPRRTRAPHHSKVAKTDLRSAVSRKVLSIPVNQLLSIITESKPMRPAHQTPVKAESAERKLFKRAKIRPFSLQYDKPHRIIGCSGVASLTYAVEFRCAAPLCVGFAVATHQEIVKHAPWLLTEFLLRPRP